MAQTQFYDGCNSCSSQNPSPYSNMCDLTVIQSGIKGLLWKACGYIIEDLEDLTEDGGWHQGIFVDNTIVGTPCFNTKGSFGDTNATTVERSYCCPPTVKYVDMPITFEDYNADCENFTHIDFYNDKMWNKAYYQLSVITCQDFVYPFLPPCNYSLTYGAAGQAEYQGDAYSKVDIGIILPRGYSWKPKHIPGICGMLQEATAA